MKNLTQLISMTLIPAMLLMSSCSMEKRVHRKGFHISSSIFKNKQKVMMTETITEKKETSLVAEIDDNQGRTKTDKRVYSTALSSINPSTGVAMASHTEHASNVQSFLKNSDVQQDVAPKKQSPNEAAVGLKNSVKKERSERVQKSPQRKRAIIIGGSLLLMAVLAGIAMPALGTIIASIGLIGIFLLDILVALGIVKYHKKEKPILAKASGLLRLLYTALLGVAIGYHIAGSVSMFNHLWGIGLIFFGIHLITLGLMYDNDGGKKWVKYLIKSLLIIAGIGYIISYVGILLVPNPVGFAALMESIFIVPMILGEVFYALWMLLKGGKPEKRRS